MWTWPPAARKPLSFTLAMGSAATLAAREAARGCDTSSTSLGYASLSRSLSGPPSDVSTVYTRNSSARSVSDTPTSVASARDPDTPPPAATAVATTAAWGMAARAAATAWPTPATMGASAAVSPLSLSPAPSRHTHIEARTVASWTAAGSVSTTARRAARTPAAASASKNDTSHSMLSSKASVVLPSAVPTGVCEKGTMACAGVFTVATSAAPRRSNADSSTRRERAEPCIVAVCTPDTACTHSAVGSSWSSTHARRWTMGLVNSSGVNSADSAMPSSWPPCRHDRAPM